MTSPKEYEFNPPTVVAAMQHEGWETDVINWLQAELPDATVFESNLNLIVQQSPGQSFTAGSGDYVLKLANGEFAVMPPNTFETFYQETTP